MLNERTIERNARNNFYSLLSEHELTMKFTVNFVEVRKNNDLLCIFKVPDILNDIYEVTKNLRKAIIDYKIPDADNDECPICDKEECKC